MNAVNVHQNAVSRTRGARCRPLAGRCTSIFFHFSDNRFDLKSTRQSVADR